jgi:hypothetical protein
MERLQRTLRIWLAVVTLACSGVVSTALPVAAAPSTYSAAYLSAEAAPAQPARATREPVATPVAAPRQTPRASAACGRARAHAIRCVRAPRLYLRHCVLLR